LREGKGEAAPNLGAIGDALASLATDVEGADRPPTKPQDEVLTEYRARLTHALDEWNASRDTDLPALNEQLQQAALSEIHVPNAHEILIGEPSVGKDLP
jgi:hypothetical protein